MDQNLGEFLESEFLLSQEGFRGETKWLPMIHKSSMSALVRAEAFGD